MSSGWQCLVSMTSVDDFMEDGEDRKKMSQNFEKYIGMEGASRGKRLEQT